MRLFPVSYVPFSVRTQPPTPKGFRARTDLVGHEKEEKTHTKRVGVRLCLFSGAELVRHGRELLLRKRAAAVFCQLFSVSLFSVFCFPVFCLLFSVSSFLSVSEFWFRAWTDLVRHDEEESCCCCCAARIRNPSNASSCACGPHRH